jgi:Protein of unknown function (DUF3570)
MKKIIFTAAAISVMLFSKAQTVTDSSGFKSRKLKIEEINFISSYYAQDGDHASVTGGIGSQKLTDLVNVLDIKLTSYDKKLRKHSFGLSCGIDQYTSASSDKIDLQANSSASHADVRVYPAIDWTIENEKKRTSIGFGLSSSAEFDYFSFGASLNFSKKTKNKNGEFNAKLQTYIDQVTLIAPVELRNTAPSGKASRQTFAGSISYSQIINDKLQVMFLADAVQQNGYLSLPFHRVYFNDGSVSQENLPDARFKIPLGFRANYFLGDMVIIKTYYRYYSDNWGLKSHTFDIELPVKITPFISVSPFYRFYNQSAIKYFAPYENHITSDQYFTSNYDMSEFNSDFFGAGIRIAPPKGVLGINHFNMLEFRYGHYTKNNGMLAEIVSLNLKFK